MSTVRHMVFIALICCVKSSWQSWQMTNPRVPWLERRVVLRKPLIEWRDSQLQLCVKGVTGVSPEERGSLHTERGSVCNRHGPCWYNQDRHTFCSEGSGRGNLKVTSHQCVRVEDTKIYTLHKDTTENMFHSRIPVEEYIAWKKNTERHTNRTRNT